MDKSTLPRLSSEQEEEIYRAIRARTLPEDRDPRLVIRDRYGGDEQLYLRDMAEGCGISLDKPR